jgi:hypothetical protein
VSELDKEQSAKGRRGSKRKKRVRPALLQKEEEGQACVIAVYSARRCIGLRLGNIGLRLDDIRSWLASLGLR